ncbi:sulfatase [Daejeonella sp.]|uniref:sulfatase family protein n=1 Tax=Daejeonella sp. TaxID=2805397 RepID=UPI0030C12F2B
MELKFLKLRFVRTAPTLFACKDNLFLMPGNHYSRFILCFFLLFIAIPSSDLVAQKVATKVNFLFIIADDMSLNAGIYGEQAIKTPAIDGLASDGVVFKKAFCAASSCSPSRASILSGKHPHELEEGGNLWSTFPSKFPNYTVRLAKMGYRIGLNGKGYSPGQVEPGGYKQNPAGPLFKSFDEFIGKLENEEPFCFWLGSSDPHRPYVAGLKDATSMDRARIKMPGWLPSNEIVRSDIADYLAEVKRFDETIGKAVALLKAKGLYENTLIIVTSDNGMPFPRAKATVYDSGSNVPLVMSWGNNFEKGRSYNELVSLIDIAPTILDAAGLTPDEAITGRSLLPLLQKNKKDKRFRQVFLERERHANVRPDLLGYPVRAIRTSEYLYVENLKPDRWPAGDPDYTIPPGPFGDIDDGPTKAFLMTNRNNAAYSKWVKASMEKRPARELYSLRDDPDQLNNLAENPENEKAVRVLKKQLDSWRRKTGDPLLGNSEDIFDTYPYYGRKGKAEQ